jgi:hypothetical protein
MKIKDIVEGTTTVGTVNSVTPDGKSVTIKTPDGKTIQTTAAGVLPGPNNTAQLNPTNAIKPGTQVNQTTSEEHEEDEEKLDELGKSTLGSYVKKASHEKGYHGYEAGRASEKGDRAKEREHSYKGEKRQKGIEKALSKLSGGPVDETQLDELGKDTLAKYVRGATDDIGHYNWMRGIERNDNWNDLDDYEQDRRLRRHDKEYNREKGIDRALKRLVKEDVELAAIKKLSGL